MKKDIHPADYRQVVFEDLASGEKIIAGSTTRSSETIKVGGKEYPRVAIEISSASHPAYTGEERALDTGGRVEKFKQRASKKK
jgi:large subunit ribosomal protein L31